MRIRFTTVYVGSVVGLVPTSRNQYVDLSELETAQTVANTSSSTLCIVCNHGKNLPLHPAQKNTRTKQQRLRAAGAPSVQRPRLRACNGSKLRPGSEDTGELLRGERV